MGGPVGMILAAGAGGMEFELDRMQKTLDLARDLNYEARTGQIRVGSYAEWEERSGLAEARRQKAERDAAKARVGKDIAAGSALQKGWIDEAVTALEKESTDPTKTKKMGGRRGVRVAKMVVDDMEVKPRNAARFSTPLLAAVRAEARSRRQIAGIGMGGANIGVL
jgi:hypothetical protein